MAFASTPAPSRRALQEALDLSDGENFRKAFLLPALENGLIEMTIPDQPTSRPADQPPAQIPADRSRPRAAAGFTCWIQAP